MHLPTIHQQCLYNQVYFHNANSVKHFGHQNLILESYFFHLESYTIYFCFNILAFMSSSVDFQRNLVKIYPYWNGMQFSKFLWGIVQLQLMATWINKVIQCNCCTSCSLLIYKFQQKLPPSSISVCFFSQNFWGSIYASQILQKNL